MRIINCYMRHLEKIINSENEFAKNLNKIIKEDYKNHVEFMKFVFHYRSFNQLYELLATEELKQRAEENLKPPSAKEYINNLVDIGMRNNAFESLEIWMLDNLERFKHALDDIKIDKTISQEKSDNFILSLTREEKKSKDWKAIFIYIKDVRNNILHGSKFITDVFQDEDHLLRIKLYNTILYKVINEISSQLSFDMGEQIIHKKQNDSCIICDEGRTDNKCMINQIEEQSKTCITCFGFLMEDFDKKHPNKINEETIKYAKII